MPDLSPDTQRFQRPGFARAYERMSLEADARGTAAHRARLLADLRGSVIEIGAGNGLNFGHYPDTVTDVLAVEPEDLLRASAWRAAERASVPISVVAGHADALPAADGAFDAAVVSLVLCSVPDPASALAEIRRVLRPGGRLCFFEHVRSARPVYALVEDVVSPLWALVAGGCHLNRDLAAAISSAGFHIDRIDRFVYRPLRLGPKHAHILGTASAGE
jgi:ubiquinone/menaquinone biosynthesis C-methylase UbiE